MSHIQQPAPSPSRVLIGGDWAQANATENNHIMPGNVLAFSARIALIRQGLTE